MKYGLWLAATRTSQNGRATLMSALLRPGTAAAKVMELSPSLTSKVTLVAGNEALSCADDRRGCLVTRWLVNISLCTLTIPVTDTSTPDKEGVIKKS